MNLMSSKEVLSALQFDLGFSDQRMTASIYRWVYEAVIDIGGVKFFPKKKEYNVSQEINLPLEYAGLERIELCGSCEEVRYDSSFGYDVCGCSVEKYDYEHIKASKQGQKILFSKNIANRDVEKIILHYYAFPLDADGKPLVPESTYQAVKAFVDYKYLGRQRMKGLTSGQRNPVPLSSVQDARMVWGAERRDAIASMVGPQNFSEALQIGRDNSLDRKDFIPSIHQSFRRLTGLTNSPY